MDVVPRDAELLQIGAHRGAREPELAKRCDRRPGGALGELLAVVSQDQPVVDIFRRSRAEGLVQAAMEWLVRPVVVAAVDVGDAEVDVVDHARQVIRRRAVFPQERDAFEAVGPDLGGRVAIALLALALPDRPLLPIDPEPAQVLEDRLLPARNVPS
jgi:hypothetical protein